MAAAETAKLIASLELKDNLTKGVNSAITSVGKLETRFGKLGQGVKTIGAGMGVALRNAALIGVTAIGGLAAGIVQMVKDGQTAAKSQKLFDNAIKSSGAVSAQYVSILTAQQQAMLQLTGTDDEIVKDIQTRLITMRATGQQTAALTPLIIAASRATGKSIETVTLAVGKGLQGNASALGRIGIALPKVTAATKSAALASLEQRKLALAADLAQAKAHGTLTKGTKAVFDHRKALLDAAIAQQKVTDASKKGTAAASSYNTIFGELNKRFGNVNDALSGQLETRLGALRESLQNVREEAGMKLAPSITKLVGVVSEKLVPAFGSFIDRILPGIITGIDKFTDLLRNGGAEQALQGITSALAPMVEMLKIAAEPVKAIVKAFLSLPSQVQGVLIGGFAINKLSGGLIGQGIGQVVGGLFQRGSTPANPLFVADVTGGLGGVAGVAAGIGAGTVAASVATVAGGALLVMAASGAFDSAATKAAEALRIRAGGLINFGGKAGGQFGGTSSMRPTSGGASLESRDEAYRNAQEIKQALIDLRASERESWTGGAAADAVAKGTEAGIIHSGVFRKAQAVREAGGFKLSLDVLRAALKTPGALGTDALVSAQAIALAQINKLRIPGDEKRDLKSAAYNLGILKRLQDKMPADLAAKLQPKIGSLEAAIDRTTQAIKTAVPTININVTASDIQRIQVKRRSAVKAHGSAHSLVGANEFG